MIKGQPKFDSIAVGNFEVDFKGSTLSFEATCAFVHSTSGKTHGWTKNRQWSPAVMMKLQELVGLMETDLAALHLDGGDVTPAPTFKPVPAARIEPEGGLGAYLGVDGVPSA